MKTRKSLPEGFIRRNESESSAHLILRTETGVPLRVRLGPHEWDVLRLFFSTCERPSPGEENSAD